MSTTINEGMGSFQDRVEGLAALMREFNLDEAELKGESWKISLKKANRKAVPSESGSAAASSPSLSLPPNSAPPLPESAPSGTPVTSPMTGIYYSAPSPNAPPFVKEGETVTAGQVVGLIEAMKVFNEINAPISGTVTKIAADNGQIVNPGEPLLYIA